MNRADEKSSTDAQTECMEYASLIGCVNVRRNSKLIRCGYFVLSSEGGVGGLP